MIRARKMLRLHIFFYLKAIRFIVEQVRSSFYFTAKKKIGKFYGSYFCVFSDFEVLRAYFFIPPNSQHT